MLDEIRRRLKALIGRLVPSGGLSEQTVKSGFWRGGIDIGGRVLQLVVLVVLARLLDPEAFGLLGIVLVTLTTLDKFSRVGINEALIQRSADNIDDYLDTAWSVQLIRGVALATILVVGAPGVAAFFKEPRAIGLLRVMAIAPVMWGLRNPALVYFEKNLDFHKLFVYNIGSDVVQFLVSIGIALVEPSVWALLLGHLASDFTQLVGSYLLHEYRPRPEFSLTMARELFGFGKWVTISSMISYFVASGDDLVVGRLLPTASLGFYQYGYRLGKASAREFTSIITTVMFPTYSKLQDDLADLREAFFHTLVFTTLLVFPMAVGTVVVAPVFVRGFLGREWMPIIPVFQLIAVYGLLSAAIATSDALWKAVGHPDYKTKVRALWLVCVAILILPLTEQFGIAGTATAIVGAYLITEVPISIYIDVSYLETTYRRFFGTIVYPFIASTAMGVTVLTVRESVHVGTPIVEFLLLVPLGVVIYTIAILSLSYWFGWEFSETYSLVVNAIRG